MEGKIQTIIRVIQGLLIEIHVINTFVSFNHFHPFGEVIQCSTQNATSLQLMLNIAPDSKEITADHAKLCIPADFH